MKRLDDPILERKAQLVASKRFNEYMLDPDKVPSTVEDDEKKLKSFLDDARKACLILNKR